jgi:hypothetical protein
MAALGWLPNLDFAGSEPAPPASGDPTDGMFLLLGVGRIIVPFAFVIEMSIYAMRIWL